MLWPACWLIAGFLAWALSTYGFTGMMLPLTFWVSQAGEGVFQEPWAMVLVRVLMPHLPEYLMAFLFCLALGTMLKVTGFRVVCFIVAANAIPLYYHLMQLAGFARHHYGSQAPALEWMVLGVISLGVVSPLCAVLGSLAGRRLNQKRFHGER